MGLILTGYLSRLVTSADAHDFQRCELVVSTQHLQFDGVHDSPKQLDRKRQLMPRGKPLLTN